MKTTTNWTRVTEQELRNISGGGWFDDFKKGFKEGFEWAIGVIKDLADFIK